MSEQLETIKCVDWTINSPEAAGVGEQTGREPICRGRPVLWSSSSALHLDTSGQVGHAAIHPSQES